MTAFVCSDFTMWLQAHQCITDKYFAPCAHTRSLFIFAWCLSRGGAVNFQGERDPVRNEIRCLVLNRKILAEDPEHGT